MFHPGSKVTFWAKGQLRQGKVREVTLWRRANEIACLVSEKGSNNFFWVLEQKLKKGW